MALRQLKTLSHDAYTVALICPLEVEMSAARFMLDEEHGRLPVDHHDTNQYVLGRLSGHNVVIASLPEGSQGTASAAAVAIHMARTFSKITLRLLIGIGGGVPSQDVDVRLGDVVVSIPSASQSGVVLYDLGKQTPDGFIRKGHLCPPAVGWLAAIPRMRSDHRIRSNMISRFVTEMTQRSSRLSDYRRPPNYTDILFQSDYKHIPGRISCIDCDQRQRVTRHPRECPDEPLVHYGLIASGNQVMKDAVHRDQLSSALGGAICFEMEAAGLMNDFSCVVIRGISDYADSHKNDTWQPYAAAAAAGLAKEILTYMDTATSFQEAEPIKSNEHFMIPRKVKSTFTGRMSLLNDIQAKLSPRIDSIHANGSEESVIYVITGMGGIGKSEVCLKVANMMRDRFWAVFWVDVSDIHSATRDFGSICQRLGINDSSILAALNALTNIDKPYLLILDNADDPDQDITSFIPPGRAGSILITSRVPEAGVHATIGSTSLEGLSDEEALNLFSASSKLSLTRLSLQGQQYARELVTDLLNCHTLAVIQAGAYIRLGYSNLESYVNLFRQSAKDNEVKARQARALQHRSKQDKSRYESVYNTFEISISFLEEGVDTENADALCLLNILALLSNKDLQIDFFRLAWETCREKRIMKGYLTSSDTTMWEDLSEWHREYLPDFLNLSSSTWDPYRLQSAIIKLHNLALLQRQSLDETEIISMHPLIHSWASIRQQTGVRDISCVQTGSLIAHMWRGDIYPQFENQIVPHVQHYLDLVLPTVFSLGPPAEMTVILLKCAMVLWRQGYFVQIIGIITIVFAFFQESSKSPTLPFFHFHLLQADFELERQKSREVAAYLRKLSLLVKDYPLDDPSNLRIKVQLSCALYRILDRECISTMEQVIAAASGSDRVWDRDLLLWKLNLAGLYADDNQLHAAIRVLESLIYVQRRVDYHSLSALGAVAARSSDDTEAIKQVLRMIIVRNRWFGAKVVLPIEDRLPELKYRCLVWSGKHTRELKTIDNRSKVVFTPTFHLLLRMGSFAEAIQHLRILEQVSSFNPKRPLWLSQELFKTMGIIQFASEEATEQALLEHFTFPARGVDLELDQLQAQQKALVFPGVELSELQKVDPALASEHPFRKFSAEEKARFIVEGRWDMFECSAEMKRLIEERRSRAASVLDGMKREREREVVVPCIDIRRQLARLAGPPAPWW